METEKKCPKCLHGYTMARKRLADLVSLLLLSGSDSMKKTCHPYFRDAPLFHSEGAVCGKDMAELTTGLAERPPEGPLGHDVIDSWKAEDKIIKAAGLDPETWGVCQECKGSGVVNEEQTDGS